MLQLGVPGKPCLLGQIDEECILPCQHNVFKSFSKLRLLQFHFQILAVLQKVLFLFCDWILLNYDYWSNISLAQWQTKTKSGWSYGYKDKLIIASTISSKLRTPPSCIYVIHLYIHVAENFNKIFLASR
jgi:hypothetical protein